MTSQNQERYGVKEVSGVLKLIWTTAVLSTLDKKFFEWCNSKKLINLQLQLEIQRKSILLKLKFEYKRERDIMGKREVQR